MNAAHPTVFLIESNPTVRADVASLVLSMGLRFEMFSTAEEFFDRVNLYQAGCVIADMDMTRMSGLQLQERLLSVGSAMSLVLVGTDVDVRTAVRAMQNGAVSVLTKPYDPDQLQDAIRCAVHVSRSDGEADQRRAALAARFDTLSPREREVLTLIVNGLPNKTIARQLGVCQRTAAQIRADVYEKMGAESAVELALMAGDLWRHEERRMPAGPRFSEVAAGAADSPMVAQCGPA